MDKKYNITFFEKDVDAVIIYMDYLCNWRKTRDDKLANSSYSIIFDAILIPMQMNYIYGYYLKISKSIICNIFSVFTYK